MKLVADVHIHSHYSRATSRHLTIPYLALWAQRKGVNIVGTGDIAHPGWLAELKEVLEPAEEGLFRLKPDWEQEVAAQVPPACHADVRFILAGEISTIYKKNGRTRKIHHVIFAPTFAAAEGIQARLEKIGNIRSDGRPILGLDSRDLLEIILEVNERDVLIPAHIWTPWFALLGSRSGFDSVEECFEDLTPYIFALETGLSSDPPMNWRVSALDRYTLVSNSDAHSPQKLVREANLLDTERGYEAIFDAIRAGDPARFLGTIEFFPEEGKYHYDGHRKCGIVWDPRTTIEHNGLCPVCGKPVTVGVMHRVEELADRPPGVPKPNALPYYSLIPLPEVIGELLGVGPNSKRVQREYERLLATLGSELAILLDIPLQEIATVGGERLAEGIGRMRRGEVTVVPGYDGEYGRIRVFEEEGKETITPVAATLFDLETTTKNEKVQEPAPPYARPEKKAHLVPAAEEEGRAEDVGISASAAMARDTLSPLLASLNPAQRKAVQVLNRPLLIVAGPGTGKTRTLTVRIAYLVRVKGVSPEHILAITFTNRASEEMQERLVGLLGEELATRITVRTFHAFGAMLLRRYGTLLNISPHFVLLTGEERHQLLRKIRPDLSARQADACLTAIDRAKGQLLSPEALSDGPSSSSPAVSWPVPDFVAVYAAYESAMRAAAALDYADLVALSVRLLETNAQVLAELQARYRWISVDEYQDVNHAQYRLLRLLTAAGANVAVIGDPDQAIYGFRGADRSYFLRFRQDYPDAKVVRLTQNYRSPQAILDAATQVINKAPGRKDAVRLFSRFVQDVKLEIYPAPTDRAEAEYVVHQIERMVGGTSYFSIDSGRVDDVGPVVRSFGDFAVLYRSRLLLPPLLEAFERAGIPYHTVGTTPWTAYPVIRRALERLRGSDGVPEELSVRQVVVRIREDILASQDLDEAAVVRLNALVDMAPVDQGGREAMERFLDRILLQNESDFYDPRADRVALMTLHAAKGLEFPVVFIVGLEEGVLPYLPGNKDVDVAEERRLFYVGMTRAREKLILSHARRRRLLGREMESPPSRFLDDIEAALKEIRQVEGKHKKERRKSQGEQLSLLDLLDELP